MILVNGRAWVFAEIMLVGGTHHLFSLKNGAESTILGYGGIFRPQKMPFKGDS